MARRVPEQGRSCSLDGLQLLGWDDESALVGVDDNSQVLQLLYRLPLSFPRLASEAELVEEVLHVATIAVAALDGPIQEQAVVQILQHPNSPRAKMGDDWPHELGEHPWRGAQPKRQCLEPHQMSTEPGCKEHPMTGVHHDVIISVLQVARQHVVVLANQMLQVRERLVLAGLSSEMTVEVPVVDDEAIVSILLRLQTGPRHEGAVRCVFDNVQAQQLLVDALLGVLQGWAGRPRLVMERFQLPLEWETVPVSDPVEDHWAGSNVLPRVGRSPNAFEWRDCGWERAAVCRGD